MMIVGRPDQNFSSLKVISIFERNLFLCNGRLNGRAVYVFAWFEDTVFFIFLVHPLYRDNLLIGRVYILVARNNRFCNTKRIYY